MKSRCFPRICLLHLLLSWPLVNDTTAAPSLRQQTIDAILEARQLFFHGKPDEAQHLLLAWETAHPEFRDNEFLCYQRFFVALHGQGDRATANKMLTRLLDRVNTGTLPATNNEFRSVAANWVEGLLGTDIELLQRGFEIRSIARERLHLSDK